jgi:hypothetical protein
MSKRNRNKISSSPVMNLIAPLQKANPITNIFVQPLKIETDSELPGYMALSTLSMGFGNAETVCNLLARVQLGRLMAYMYFEDRVARKLHDIIKDFFVWMADQADESTSMKLGATLSAKLGDALNITGDMQRRLTKHELTTLSVRFVNQDRAIENEQEYTYLERCTWDEYKDFFCMTPTQNVLVEA